MKKHQVFLSYDGESERHYKNLLLAWNAKNEVNFKLSDPEAAAASKVSTQASASDAVAATIDEASVFLVIVGQSTHKSESVRAEIRKARELGKPIIAVKTDAKNPVPDELHGAGATLASFNFESITNAINKK